MRRSSETRALRVGVVLGGLLWVNLAAGQGAPVEPPVAPEPAPAPAPAPEVTPPPAPAVVDAPAAAVDAPKAELGPVKGGQAGKPAAFAWQKLLPKMKFTAMFYNYLGEGTFAVDRHVRNPMYSWWVSLRPRLMLPYGFSVSARQDLDLEWTHTENNTYDRQPLLGDTRFGVGYGGLAFENIGLKFTVYSGARVPISLESRFRRQVTTLDMGAGFDWSKWGVIVSFVGFGALHARQPGKPVFEERGWASQWFNTGSGSSGYVDRSGQYIPTQKCIGRAAELASGGCPASGAANGNLAQLLASTTLGYDFSALLGVPVSFVVSLTTIHGFSSYFGPDDEYTPENGVVGIKRNDITSGQVALAWQALDWLTLDIGTSSMQPLMNKTNQYVRFPFWNIPYWDLKGINNYSGAGNYSTLSLGATLAL